MTHKNIGFVVVACGLAMAYAHSGRDLLAAEPDVAASSSDKATSEFSEMSDARRKAETLKFYGEIAFDPTAAGLLAISSLAEIKAEPEERAKAFENLLSKTKELGLRNALRMVLHEIYANAGAVDEMLENLSQMLAENDAALAEHSEDDQP